MGKVQVLEGGLQKTKIYRGIGQFADLWGEEDFASKRGWCF